MQLCLNKRCQLLFLQDLNAPAAVPLLTVKVIQLESGMSDLLAEADAQAWQSVMGVNLGEAEEIPLSHGEISRIKVRGHILRCYLRLQL